MEPCVCNAYSFPHRAGSGKCSDPGPRPESCADCPYHIIEHHYGPDVFGDYIECELVECYWDNVEVTL